MLESLRKYYYRLRRLSHELLCKLANLISLGELQKIADIELVLLEDRLLMTKELEDLERDNKMLQAALTTLQTRHDRLWADFTALTLIAKKKPKKATKKNVKAKRR
jgi:hypothetical protein